MNHAMDVASLAYGHDLEQPPFTIGPEVQGPAGRAIHSRQRHHRVGHRVKDVVIGDPVLAHYRGQRTSHDP